MSVRYISIGSGKAVRNGQIQTLIYFIKHSIKERRRSLITINTFLKLVSSESPKLLPSEDTIRMVLSHPNLTIEIVQKLSLLVEGKIEFGTHVREICDGVAKEIEKLQRDMTFGIPRESVLKAITGRGLRLLRKKWEQRNSLMSYVSLVKRLEKKLEDLQQLRAELESIFGSLTDVVGGAE